VIDARESPTGGASHYSGGYNCVRARFSRWSTVTLACRLMSDKGVVENSDVGRVYFNVPGVASVSWAPSLQSVVETWEGWADATEFAAILEAGIQALRENNGSRWLADCRLQRVLRAADQKAGNEHWLPRALAAGLKRFAVVFPESGLAKANIQDHLRPAASARLDVAYFSTLEEARQWLTDDSRDSDTEVPPISR